MPLWSYRLGDRYVPWVTRQIQRRQISEFTFAALQGDYDAVYLTEVKRSIHGDKQSDLFIGNLIPRSRYGKATEKDVITYKEVFATKAEVVSDDKFNKARNVYGHHYFKDNDPMRKTVESQNIRSIINFATKNNESLLHLTSMHIPSQNRHNLSKASGKEFEGLLKDFLACKDIPIMLEENIAPQFGLFNGATYYFHGLLYLPDDLDVNINKADFEKK